MNVVSNSTLGWLDSSEQERRTVLELVSALNEPGTLDELGIGTIRDTIADTLFPGISTIQTRARYFLFIPWILQMAESGSPRYAEEKVRRLQLQLCDALVKTHGTDPGVIGRQAGAALQRWPTSIYWLGLVKWGICRHPGSSQSYFENQRRPSAWHQVSSALEDPAEGHRDEALDGVRGNWTSIPEPPTDFPEVASFALTPEEGLYLRERVVLTNPQSYLAQILQFGTASDSGDSEYPWDHPASETAPASVQAWLRDARNFSLVHRGSTLLYNLMLAQALEHEEGIERYSNALAEWTESMAIAEFDVRRWDRATMWKRLLGVNPRLRARTRDFVDRWYVLASSSDNTPIWDSQEARRLIRDREHTLKGGRARLTYAEARDRRRGYPTSARLEFRWTQVRRITSDILSALENT